MEAVRWMLKDLLLFALLPACCGALAVAATLALPGGADAAAASPRALFSACLINGIAAFTLPGVIQVWFTMGETRRANQERELAVAERERSAQLEERLTRAEERANQAEEVASQSQAELAETRSRMAEIETEMAELRRHLAERDNGSGAH